MAATRNQFLMYLKLAPKIDEALHRKIMTAAPHYGDFLTETVSSLKMLIHNKQIMITNREKRITACLQELKLERDKVYLEGNQEKMLGLLPEISRIYVDCRSHHKQTISVLAKYGLAILYFILIILVRMNDSDDWI